MKFGCEKAISPAKTFGFDGKNKIKPKFWLLATGQDIVSKSCTALSQPLCLINERAEANI